MIGLLSDALQCHLRSGVTVTTFSQCVDELVFNAIDAGCSCLAVRVDVEKQKVQVVDNGNGICREDFDWIGIRHYTSKCHSLQDLENPKFLGFRGEALASICNVAEMAEIVSRQTNSRNTYTRVFKRGLPKEVVESQLYRPSQGTTITVLGLFYNMPVRRKALNSVLELEDIRYCLERTALIHPDISFSLRNDHTGLVLLQTHKSSTIIGAFAHLFGHEKAQDLREICVDDDSISISGYISCSFCANKNLQFVYINKRLVLNTKIHKLVNNLLRKSLVISEKVTITDASQGLDASSPQKQDSRHGVFLLNVSCPVSAYDITFEPSKTLVEFKNWDRVLSNVQKCVSNFLCVHNLTISVPEMEINFGNPDKVELNNKSFHGNSGGCPGDVKSRSSEIDGMQEISVSNLLNSMESLVARRPLCVIGNCCNRLQSCCSGTQVSYKDEEPQNSICQCPLSEVPSSSKDSDKVLEDCAAIGLVAAEVSASSVLSELPLDVSAKGFDVWGVGGQLAREGNSRSSFLPESPLNVSVKGLEGCAGGGQQVRERNSASSDLPGSLLDVSVKLQSSKLVENSEDKTAAICNKGGSGDGSSIVNVKLKDHDSTDGACPKDYVKNPSFVNTRESSVLRRLKRILSLDKPRDIHHQEMPYAGSNSAEQTSHGPLSAFRKFTKLKIKQISATTEEPPMKKMASLAELRRVILRTSTASSEQLSKCVDEEYAWSTYANCNPLQEKIRPNETSCQNVSLCQYETVHQTCSQSLNKKKIHTCDKSVQTDECFGQFSETSVGWLHQKPKDRQVFLSRQSLLQTAQITDFESAVKHFEKTDPKVCHDGDQLIAHQTPHKELFVSKHDINFSQSQRLKADYNVQLAAYNGIFLNGDTAAFSQESRAFQYHSACNSNNPIIDDSGECLSNHTASVTSDKYPFVCQKTCHESPNDLKSVQSLSQTPVSCCNLDYMDCQTLSDVPSGPSLSTSPCQMLGSVCDDTPTATIRPLACNHKILLETQNILELFSPKVNYDSPNGNAEQSSCFKVDDAVSHCLPNRHHSPNGHSRLSNVPSALTPHFSCVNHAIAESQGFELSSEHLSQEIVVSPKLNEGASQELLYSQGFDVDSCCSKSAPSPADTICSGGFDLEPSVLDSSVFVLSPLKSGCSGFVANGCSCGCVLKNGINCTDPKLDSVSDLSDTKDCNEVMEENFEKCSSASNSCPKIDLDGTTSTLKQNGSLWTMVENRKTGQDVFINVVTGKTSNVDPTCHPSPSSGQLMEQGGLFTMLRQPLLTHNAASFLKPTKARFDCPTSIAIPSNLSSLFEEHKSCLDSDHFTKWRSYHESISVTDNTSRVLPLLKDWNNPVFNRRDCDVISTDLTQLAGVGSGSRRAHALLNSCTFTKEMFMDIKVLGQVDCKFIVCLMVSQPLKNESREEPDLLVLFDQHAVDERIQLERILAEMYTDDDDKRLLSSCIDPPVTVCLDRADVRLAKAYWSKFADIGISFSNDESPEQLVITSVPSFLISRETKNERSKTCTAPTEVLEVVVKEFLQLLHSTRGGATCLPRCLTHIINTKACRGAIKFGDPLSWSQCQALLRDLSCCSLPFQCAHGRPSVVPLFSVHQLEQRCKTEERNKSKPSLWKLRRRKETSFHIR